MKKRILNILIITFQGVISLLLLVYLIVPVYEESNSSLSGNTTYSPYENWEQSPVRIVSVKNDIVKGTTPDQQLHFYPYLNDESLLILDSIKPVNEALFHFGRSRDDIQYLIKNSNTQGAVVYRSSNSNSLYFPPLKGIHLQLISEEEDLNYLDKLLNEGIPMALIAGEGNTNYLYNQLMTNTGSAFECMKALKEGHNLIVFSDEEVYSSDIESIPVIRNIEWKNDELTIDLSEKGTISIVSSGFNLDTLSQNLHLKIKQANWFRFKVDFLEKGISYLSNPFFRYTDSPYKTIYPKANNQLTIFINLSWLIAVILLNYIINLFRRKYI